MFPEPRGASPRWSRSTCPGDKMPPFLRSVSLPPRGPSVNRKCGSLGGGVRTLPPDELMNWDVMRIGDPDRPRPIPMPQLR
eukprot:4861693-Alexandrium_andersonii.AAC.1